MIIDTNGLVEASTGERLERGERDHDAFHANDSYDIEPTDITTSLSAADACDTNDVRINDYGYGTDTYKGWFECHVFNSAQNCNEGHAHINTSYSDIPEDDGSTLSIVCEEIGHSVGLAHSKTSDPGYTSSCMWTSQDDGHLTSHDKGVLDANY